MLIRSKSPPRPPEEARDSAEPRQAAPGRGLQRAGKQPGPASADLVDALEQCEEVVTGWKQPTINVIAGQEELWMPKQPRRHLLPYLWWSVRHSKHQPYRGFRVLLGYSLVVAGAAAVALAIAQALS